MMGAQNARTLVKNQCRQNWARGVEADECSQELFESWWRLSHLNVEYRTIAEKMINEVL
jgi:hypothetical protein